MVTVLPRPTARISSSVPSRLVHARLAVIATFALCGMLFASWVPRIPEVKDRLDLSPSALGLALLAPAIGSLIAMNVAGALSAKYGTRATTRAFGVLFCATGWLPGLAGNLPLLFGLMLLWGLGIGGLDVAMNAQAISVEKAYGRPLMSGFHAAWSLGSLAGAGVGTIGAAYHISIAGQQALIAIVLAAVALYVSRYLIADPGADPDVLAPGGDIGIELGASPRWADRVRRGPLQALDLRIFLLGVAALFAMLSEGSVGDWSGILLRDSLHSSASHVGLGFAAFMATETIGRLFGDRIVLRLGRVRAVTAMASIGAIGLAIGMATHTVAGAIAGFALLGLGLSIMVPVAFSAAADGRIHAGPAIALVSTFGYTGFLAGPSGIGVIAQATSVPAALWLVPILTALGGLFSVIAVRRRASVRYPGKILARCDG